MPHVSMVLTPGFQFLALGVQAAFGRAISEAIASTARPVVCHY
ncbi:hypothetical protein QE372_005276 [Agrobacterium pusense]|nr:hypothetical protein [Agrobacterium pusense]MDR6192942.1 hypothetical protein [Agrobacterium pusense]